MKTITILGYEIKDNLCSALNIRVYDKTFGLSLLPTFQKEPRKTKDGMGKIIDTMFSVNHMKVMKLLNSAVTYKIVLPDKDSDELIKISCYLVIETETHTITVLIPEVKR